MNSELIGIIDVCIYLMFYSVPTGGNKELRASLNQNLDILYTSITF